MKPYRVAIIGTGAIAGAHYEALRQAGERVKVVAATDTDAERAKAFGEKFSIPRLYTTSTEMLAAEKPDLVHITTPPAPHRDLIIEALEAGAWVYCEKPLCASLEQFDQITAAEARTGRYCSTVFQWRFGSATKHIKRLMETGEMGRPLVSVCQTLWFRDMAYYQVPWRGKWATEIGGPTMTLGIHLTDLLLWLMGDWEEVRAMVGTLDRAIEVEDISMALVRFKNGSFGSITNSALSPRQESYLRLDFQRATVEMSGLYRADNSNWTFSIADRSPDAEALARWKNIEQDIAGSHDVQLSEMLDSMDRNERPLVSGDSARCILEFSTSLYKAGFTGQPVLRGSITPDDPFYYAMNGAVQTQHSKR